MKNNKSRTTATAYAETTAAEMPAVATRTPETATTVVTTTTTIQSVLVETAQTGDEPQNEHLIAGSFPSPPSIPEKIHVPGKNHKAIKINHTESIEFPHCSHFGKIKVT